MSPLASGISRRRSALAGIFSGAPTSRARGLVRLVGRSGVRVLSLRRQRTLWETAETLWVVFLLMSMLVGWGYLGWQVLRGVIFIVRVVMR